MAHQGKPPSAAPRPTATHPDLRHDGALHQLEVLAHVEAVAVEADLQDSHFVLVDVDGHGHHGGLRRPGQAEAAAE